MKRFLSFFLVNFFLASALASNLAQAEPVKRSKSGICHDTNSPYYTRVTRFTAFDSLSACLEAGGRLPKRATSSPKALVHQETNAALRDGRPFSGPYQRDHWPHWLDEDKDCQNTRAEVLIARSQVPVTYTRNNRCTVATGLWVGALTGQSFTQASDVDIDHLVPLKWAHGHGGEVWSRKKKAQFANDPDNLLIADDALNAQKGAKGPDEWLPPVETLRCDYVYRFDRIVARYQLHYVPSEREAVNHWLAACGYGPRG
jgi:hypothetical protein